MTMLRLVGVCIAVTTETLSMLLAVVTIDELAELAL